MTETDWSAELAITCAACGAPAGSPCRTVRGHPVEYMHIDRVADAAAPLVAWMRDRMSEEPYGLTAKDVRAYREANGLSAEDMAAAYEAATRKIEIREDAAGTDSLIEAVTRKLDGEDVYLRGEEWRASIDSPYSLVLRQWADSGECDEPTGPKVRVTFTVHVEEQP